MQADAEDLMLDIPKLGLFNRTSKEGDNTVPSHLSDMTGMQTRMEITKTNCVDVADIKRGVGAGEQIGINIELLEPPQGHVLFLFQADDAKTLAGA